MWFPTKEVLDKELPELEMRAQNELRYVREQKDICAKLIEEVNKLDLD